MSWKDALARRDEARSAFMEGHRMGMDGREPREAWMVSQARARLSKLSKPEGICRSCREDAWRLSVDAWICGSCLNPAIEAAPSIAGPRPEHQIGTSIGEASAAALGNMGVEQ